MQRREDWGLGGLPAGAIVIALCAGLAGCGKGRSSGGDGGGPLTGPVLPDFGVRRDVRIGPGFQSDALTLDLDGDGRVDLVEGNFQQATVTVALGNPDGTFTTLAALPTLGAPWQLAAGDVDGNGLADLAVTCLDDRGAFPAGVQVFFQGPGPGEFGPSVSRTLASRPLDVALAPESGVAGDTGPAELFVADRQAGAILRLRFDGSGLVDNGSIDSAALGAAGRPISVALVDVGADGWLDLVAGEVEVEGGGPDRVVLYPRDGAGFGPAEVVLAPLVLPVVALAGDVDANGYDDVSVAQLGSNEAFLLAGDASGLPQFLSFDFEGTTSSIVFGDLDGDGLLDLAGTVLERDTVSVRLATGPLEWAEPSRYNAGHLPRALGIVKLAGDDLPDLVCASTDDFALFPGRGDGTFRGAVGCSVTEGPVFAQAADLDGDGDQDVVTITERQTAVCFLENDGTGNLTLARSIPLVTSADDNFGHLAIADMDNDGRLDVVASIYQADQVWIFRNTGTIAGFEAPAPHDVVDVGPRPIGIGVGDLDNDGTVDLIVGITGNESVQCFTNAGNAELALDAALVLGDRPGFVRCADLDGDGNLDVVLDTGGAGTNERLVVYEGHGNGLLTQAYTGDLDTLGASLATADLDGDGLLDVVVGQPGVGQTDVYVAWNRGALSFDLVPLTIGEDPGNVLVLDVDRDGALDVLVASASGDLRWALGDGAGGFPVVEPDTGELAVPYATVSAVAADLDGDDLDDLILVSPMTPLVWSARNTSVALPAN